MFLWKSNPGWRQLLVFILCPTNNTSSLRYCKTRSLGAETERREERKCALRALQAHFISMTCRCLITAWFLCPGGRQFHFMYDFILCMENSEWYLIPLDLNSVKIFLKYTLACYDHRAKFFPWVLRKCLVHIMKSLIHATWFIRMASNHILFLPYKYYNTEFYKVALWNIFAKEKWFLSCELKNKQQKITDKSQTLQHAAMSWINGLSSSSKRNS